MKGKIEKLGKVSITVEKDYWDKNKAYNRLTIVERQGTSTAYLSRKAVPIGIDITDRNYWITISKWADIPYEIVQEFGDSPELVISQKVVTLKVNELQELIDNINDIIGEGSIDERIAEEGAKHYTKEETYSKTELNNLITTPDQQYVSVASYQDLPDTGSADTIYRVGGTTSYSEYAWDGTDFVLLSEKNVGIDDEPTAGSNNLVDGNGIFKGIAESGAKSYNISMPFTLNGYYHNDGTIDSTTNAKHTPITPIYGYSGLSIKTSLSSRGCTIAFFDKNKTFLSNISIPGQSSGLNTIDVDLTLDDYRDVVFVSVSTYGLDISPYYAILLNNGNLEDRIENLEDFKEETKTIVKLSLSDYINYGYINTDGDFIPNTAQEYKATDFIKLYSNKISTIEFKGLYSGNSSVVLCFYDENFNKIGGTYNNVSASAKVTLLPEDIPSSAKYIRGSTKLTYSQSDAYLIVTYKYKDYLKQLDDDTLYFEEKPDILNNELQFTLNGYYKIDGTITPTSSAVHTPIVPISNYSSLAFRANLSSESLAVAFFDKNKIIMPSISIAGEGDTIKDIDLTDANYTEAKFISVSCYGYDSTKHYARLHKQGSINDKVNSLYENKLLLIPQKQPLNILIFGDSISDSATITVDTTNVRTTAYNIGEEVNISYRNSQGVLVSYALWPRLIRRYLKIYDERCYAKSGASYHTRTVTAGNERQNLDYQLQLALNDINNPNGAFKTVGEYVPDIVIFALGINDGVPNQATENYDSAMAKTIYKQENGQTTAFIDYNATMANLDRTNRAEAVRYAFMFAKKYFPMALIFCVLPLQTCDRDVDDIDGSNNTMNKLIRQLAHRYSIHVIDGARDMGIIRDTETSQTISVDVDGTVYSCSQGEYLKDGLHPNEKGQNLYARLILSNIRKEWIDMSLMN